MSWLLIINFYKLEFRVPLLVLISNLIVLCVLVGFMSLWHKLESSERREPQLRKCLHKIHKGICLVIDGEAQPIVGGHIPGCLVFVSIAARLERDWDGKGSWQSGAKEYHKVIFSIAAHSPAPGKGFPSVTTLPCSGSGGFPQSSCYISALLCSWERRSHPKLF